MGNSNMQNQKDSSGRMENDRDPSKNKTQQDQSSKGREDDSRRSAKPAGGNY